MPTAIRQFLLGKLSPSRKFHNRNQTFELFILILLVVFFVTSALLYLLCTFDDVFKTNKPLPLLSGYPPIFPRLQAIAQTCRAAKMQGHSDEHISILVNNYTGYVPVNSSNKQIIISNSHVCANLSMEQSNSRHNSSSSTASDSQTMLLIVKSRLESFGTR